jgi:benzylsuccinate CoA-transferase BbsF subunit
LGQANITAPLTGIHVLDLSWVMVGPASARYLADLGADVVKVESSKRIDPVRTLPPFKDGKPGPERTLSYHNLNAGKRCATINLKEPRGRDLVLRLVEWADVVLESFTAGVLDSMGLGYQNLAARNRSVIMVSTCLFGQTGPHAQGTSGVGTGGASFAGANFLMGWPDRPPCGTWGPWTDAVTPRFIASSVLAAIHRRSRTGEGCYIDVAQAEAGLQFLLPAFYEYAANGTIPNRRGSAGSALRAPAGVYPCLGPDRWVAIEASDSPRFDALRHVVGGPVCEPRFDTLLGRLRHREELDRELANWTRPQQADAIEERLQAAQVPAHVVSTDKDLFGDAHLRAARHFRKVSDPIIGDAEIEAPRFQLHRTPHVEIAPGPRIGQHTKEILTGICGLSENEIAELTAAGILT